MKREILKIILKKMEEKNIPVNSANIQRIVFYLKEKGIPVNYKYEPYFYEPHSFELQYELDDMVFWGEIEERDGVYLVNSLVNNNPYAFKINRYLNEFTNALNDFSPDTMDMFGILVYCIRAVAESERKKPTKENVLEEFVSWRGSKYRMQTVASMFDKVSTLVPFS